MLNINNISAAAVVAALLVVAARPANARPYQYIPEVPGWIPVYIRQGDQPLSEIHPALAAAFREEIQPIRLDDSANKNLLAEINDNSAESQPLPPAAKENAAAAAIDANNPVEKNDFPQKTDEALDDDDSVVMKIAAKPSALDKAELKRLTKELNKRTKKTE